MNRWLTATLLAASAALASSASASPTTRPASIPATIYQSASSIRSQVNASRFELKKMPDLSAYVPQSNAVSIGGVELPNHSELKKLPDLSAYLDGSAAISADNLWAPSKPNSRNGTIIIPQKDQPLFDPLAKIRIPASESGYGNDNLKPNGPSFMFNGLSVFVEPVAFAPTISGTSVPTTRK